MSRLGVVVITTTGNLFKPRVQRSHASAHSSSRRFGASPASAATASPAAAATPTHRPASHLQRLVGARDLELQGVRRLQAEPRDDADGSSFDRGRRFELLLLLGAIVRAVAVDAGAMKRVVEEASARAAGVVAVKLAPATCRARRTAAICVRAMAHAALAGVLVADGPMIAREAAASALTSLLRRVRSGPERAPRDAVLSDLRERGFDADLARLATGGEIRATAVVRSAARFLSRALVSRARRDAV